MGLLSVTNISFCLFICYISHSLWTFYHMYYVPPCTDTQRCISSWIRPDQNGNSRTEGLQLLVYGSVKKQLSRAEGSALLWSNESFDPHLYMQREVNVSIPAKTRNNGSYYLHMFVAPRGADIFAQNQWVSSSQTALTAYSLPKLEAFNLMGEEKAKITQDVPVTHWRRKVTISVMADDASFDRRAIPAEVYKFLKVHDGRYLPITYVDELSFRVADLMKVENDTVDMPLTLYYQPISVGKLRLWENIKRSFESLHQLGFGEKDVDELKGIFADTNLYLLLLTFFVAAVHILFDFLAFKNDISYWRKRKDMVGLSSRVVVWRCISTLIIFLYLMDEDTSLLVLIPTGISAIIEIWKMKKALKVFISWRGWKPSIQFGTTSDKEKETEAFDAKAMKYLSYVLYPLLLAGAVYSLIYVPHKSWYSWCLQSLVNGVYGFGFLFMLPQLFVNYKLKSVAHLPWKAFMYKAFNTFIDDIFAFIITMPTAHRLACFRDDAVFLVYLYQRWLYPVDKTRVNEFGQSFEDGDHQAEKPEKLKSQ